MIESDVIEHVDYPTDWVNAIICKVKKDDSLRICLDPRPLNKYIKREYYTIPTVADIITNIGKP